MIHLDSEIVASAYDDATGVCSYTLERNGKQWTVQIPREHFDQHGGDKQLRRNHLARVLEQAMQGPCDAERKAS